MKIYKLINNMIDFFNPDLKIFTFFAIFAFVLILFELTIYLFGSSLTHFLDIDLNHEMYDTNLFSFSSMPFIIKLFLFSIFFAFIGINLKINIEINYYFNVILSSFASYKILEAVSVFWEKWFPEVQSYSIDKQDFLSMKGNQLSGIMTYENSAQIKIVDSFNNLHYLNCKPANPKDIYQTGDLLTIVSYENGFYYVVKE